MFLSEADKAGLSVQIRCPPGKNLDFCSPSTRGLVQDARAITSSDSRDHYVVRCSMKSQGKRQVRTFKRIFKMMFFLYLQSKPWIRLLNLSKSHPIVLQLFLKGLPSLKMSFHFGHFSIKKSWAFVWYSKELPGSLDNIVWVP